MRGRGPPSSPVTPAAQSDAALVLIKPLLWMHVCEDLGSFSSNLHRPNTANAESSCPHQLDHLKDQAFALSLIFFITVTTIVTRCVQVRTKRSQGVKSCRPVIDSLCWLPASFRFTLRFSARTLRLLRDDWAFVAEALEPSGRGPETAESFKTLLKMHLKEKQLIPAHGTVQTVFIFI